MKTTTTLLTALAFVLGNATVGQVVFQRTYGGTSWDEGLSVQQTSDEGYIIVGSTESFGLDSFNVYMVKTDASGDILWTKTYGGTGDDFGSSVQQTSDGGYIITGTTQSFAAGMYDVYLLKTDASGDTLWTRTYGGANGESGRSVQQTYDGGYVISGNAYDFAGGNGDVYLIKTDTLGDTLWTRAFGGWTQDKGNSVLQTIDSGYVIMGTTASFGAGSNDVYLIKTDANGDTLWTKTYGGTSTDRGNSIQQTADGGYIITGTTASFGAGNYDVYLIKTDASGDTLWTKAFGGTNGDNGYSVQQTADGGYIITGGTISFGAGNTDVYLIKTDASGDTLWTKAFGGTSGDWGYSVQQTTDGGYIITGYAAGLGAGNYDVYLIKTDSLGNSGCNEYNTSTVVSNTATIIGSGAIVGSGGIVGNPATIVSNTATIDSTLCIGVGINQSAIGNNQSITIYPNPAKHILYVKLGEREGTVKYSIYDLLGRNVKSGQLLPGDDVINLPRLRNGMYIIRFSNGEMIESRKFVKKN